MQAADAFWHVTNFFAPAVFLGTVAAALTRLIWRREIGRGRGVRLWAWATGASAIVSMAGLVIFERDGRMATYGAMVLGCGAALWWAGFGGGGKR